MWDKQRSVVITNKTSKNDVFIVDQSTITANEPQNVYIAITQIRQILITHRRYINCKTIRRITLAPLCSSNS